MGDRFTAANGKIHAYHGVNPVAIIRLAPFGTPSPPTSDPATIGQFTGKTDSTGRDIYEGDTVRSYKDNTVCIFTDCGFRLQPTERRVHPFFLRGNLTVIGNIHDNPEVK